MSVWRRCSSCRSEIGFGEIHWVCSVSTCARVAKAGLFFCSVGCWEAHLPTMRHREAWAVEARSPSEAEWRASADREEAAPAARARPVLARAVAPVRSDLRRQVVAAPAPARAHSSGERDVLVVVSKLKKYVKDTSGMNTSDTAIPVLSDHLRRLCDLAAEKAREDGRKTIMDRDFSAILRG